MSKLLKRILVATILCFIYLFPTIARAACAENEIDVLGDGTQCELAKFTVTTTELAANTAFSFRMSAKGTFYVDCGDGGTLSSNVSDVSGMIVTRSNTTDAIYTCTYTTAGNKIIRFGGVAAMGAPYENRAYASVAAISFYATPTLVAGISGSLGAIFPTRGNSLGEQPQFFATFLDCTNLTGSIPENLFAGIYGQPRIAMFDSTFLGCTNLSSSIPENLFAGISGAPAKSMFANTFAFSNITGSIPAGLFSGISGAPAESMFASTFAGCTGLTGSIPAGLFSRISGAPANYMFNSTFYGCNGLTGYVPPELFQGIELSTSAKYQMGDIFTDTGLATSCPACYTQYITGFEEYWDGKVACEASLGENEYLYKDVCYQFCDAGITKLKTSTGLEFPIFDTKPTTPALHIKHNGTVCYTPMELGNGGTGSMNIMSGGETYHLGTLE